MRRAYLHSDVFYSFWFRLSSRQHPAFEMYVCGVLFVCLFIVFDGELVWNVLVNQKGFLYMTQFISVFGLGCCSMYYLPANCYPRNGSVVVVLFCLFFLQLFLVRSLLLCAIKIPDLWPLYIYIYIYTRVILTALYTEQFSLAITFIRILFNELKKHFNIIIFYAFPKISSEPYIFSAFGSFVIFFAIT